MDEAELAHLRRQKDEAFRRDPRSPIPAEERPSFGGLRYFPFDAGLVLDLEVEPVAAESLELPTSDGSVRTYRWAGRIRFEVDGEPAELTLLAGGDEPGYFLPFRDSTSGKESYGAGRYLDLEPAEDGLVRVDFNLAYNPYCAYDDAFSCPLPPPENWLRVPIRAGEATFRD